ncbi:MAG: hypothetical protein QW618_03055 [Nitrososphaerales archaeon]
MGYLTHTLHRIGDKESLKNDFPWLITPRIGVNDDNLAEKLNKAIDVVEKAGIKFWGYAATVNTLHMSPSDIREKLIKQVSRGGAARLRGIGTSSEQLKDLLKLLKEADLGLSVTISGLRDEIFAICREVGLKPHSVNLSLGIWGMKELLPPKEVLEITTMCGHSLISPRLVIKLANEIKEGKKKPKEAAITLAKLCPCGVFNIERAERLLAKLANITI